jgi:hypothetical protein
MLRDCPSRGPLGKLPICSPSKMFFSWKIRTLIPMLGSNEPDLAMSAMSRETKRSRMRENSNASGTELCPLTRGDKVWMQDRDTKEWTHKAEILQTGPIGRSYIVKMKAGTISKQNRKFLKVSKLMQDDTDLDQECARIKVTRARYCQDSTPRQKESCLSRRRTSRAALPPQQVKRTSFGDVTVATFLGKGKYRKILSVALPVKTAKRRDVKTNFEKKQRKGWPTAPKCT